MTIGWEFIDTLGTFRLKDPDRNSYLYFPLVNEAGMISSVTPTLNGDAKADQKTFLLLPTSVEDLHNSRATRNFWLRIDENYVWSATGNGAEQTARSLSHLRDESTMTAGFLWHSVRRQHPATGLVAEVTNFVPITDDHVELMRVTLKNKGKKPLRLDPTAAIPIFGRSADNLHVYRHVTSLLHRTSCHQKGVLVRPTLSFDEHGHTVNQTTFAVLGTEADGISPVGFFADVKAFVGEGGTLDWPEAVVANKIATQVAGGTLEGYESIGGIRFRTIELLPGAEKSYVIILGILHNGANPDALIKRYGTGISFAEELQKTKFFWCEKTSTLLFETNNMTPLQKG